MSTNEPTSRCYVCDGDFEEGQPVYLDIGEDGQFHPFHADCLK